jgi:uncharacterized membrane protein YbhN (UPF0104 family)
VATIVVERVIDMIMLILAFGLALFAAEVTASPTLTELKSKAWIIAAVGGSALAALFVLRTHGAWLVRLIPFRRVASWLDSFLQGLSFLRSGRSLGIVALHSVILWILIVLQFWFMLLGMNFTFSLAASTLVMAGAALGSVVQIPGVGGGFQAGYFLIMTALHVPREQAIATSLIAFVFSFFPTVVIAPLFMVGQGFSLRELKASVPKPESEAV